MFWTPLTTEEMQKVIDFIEKDDASVLDTDIPQRLSGICFAFQKKAIDFSRVERRARVRLEKKLQGKEKVMENELLQDDLPELAFDSVDVACAILYFLQGKGSKITKTKLICILYEVYAAWLVSHRERLFIEHPVAYEHGPWFWRVSTKIRNVYTPVPKSIVDKIFNENSGVGVLIQRAAEKYHDYSEAELTAYLLKSKPYRNAAKDKNNGKWNKEISDADIYYWKRDQKKGNQQ